MARVTWSLPAVTDLELIADYIRRDSPRYATRAIRDITTIVRRIPSAPFAGRIVPEFQDENLRERFYKSYRIIYRIIDGRIEIVRIKHMSMDLKSL
jgi:plasmid stabilization system protein ParE